MTDGMDESTRQKLIGYAVFYSQNTYLWALLSFRIFTAITGIVTLTVLKIHRKKFFAHPNLTSLMNWHSFWTLLLTVFVLIDHLITVKDYLTESPNNLLLSNLNCFLRRIPIICVCYGAVSSMLMMSIERYYASKNFRTYEMTDRRLGNWLNGIHIAISLCLSAVAMSTYSYPLGMTAYCGLVTSPLSDIVLKCVATILLVMEIFTLVAFAKLKTMNERMLEKEKETNLSERYQIEENVRMLRLLLPVVCTHTIITIAGLCAFIIYYTLEMEPVNDPIFEDSLQFVHLQSICMPVCFYIQYRRSLHRNAEIMSANRETGVAYIVKYYDCIQKGW